MGERWVNEIGLELAPSREPVEMLVMERAANRPQKRMSDFVKSRSTISCDGDVATMGCPGPKMVTGD
jgi:hypothetical protein